MSEVTVEEIKARIHDAYMYQRERTQSHYRIDELVKSEERVMTGLETLVQNSAILSKEEVREALADYAHAAWSGWMKYMFEKTATTKDGYEQIPDLLVVRWKRQMNTPYAELPENEKESDRAEADKMLNIIKREVAS